MERALGGVVVAHPGRQHAYEAALAAQDYGLLQSFATGFYVRRPDVARALAAAGSVSPLLGSAADRFHPSLDRSLIRTFRAGHIPARALRHLRGSSSRRRAEEATDRAIAHWLSSLRPSPKVVHGWEGASLHTLRTGRAIGAATVLDSASAHERFVAVREEEDGIRATGQITARVVAERELADAVLAPSQFVEDCLLESGVPATRIVRLPFGTDPDRFAPVPGRSDGVFRALFIGPAATRKGLRYLIEAWDELGLPRAELVIAGATDFGIGKGRRGTCLFLGQVPRTRIASLFAQSDVFVFPSLAEGSALVTYEAMAAGVPVLTTPNAGSVVEDGIHGFLVPPRDVAAIRDRLRELYDAADRRREMGEAARELILSRYTWRHYRRRLAAVYDALASGEDARVAVSKVDARPLEAIHA